MASDSVLKLALMLHITGLALAGGVTFVNYLAYGRFTREYQRDRQRGMTIVSSVSKLPTLIMLGMATSIVSGIVMMHLAFQAAIGQLWFQVKLGAIVFLIINGVIGNRLMAQLRKTLDDSGDMLHEVASLGNTIRVSIAGQLLMFLLIFMLATFRFV